jgi:protein-tyrosine phosphatase-like protein
VELDRVGDDRVVLAARDGIARDFPDVDAGMIEQIVTEELAGLRERARVQTFVPILAQRTARARVRAVIGAATS